MQSKLISLSLNEVLGVYKCIFSAYGSSYWLLQSEDCGYIHRLWPQ